LGRIIFYKQKSNKVIPPEADAPASLWLAFGAKTRKSPTLVVIPISSGQIAFLFSYIAEVSIPRLLVDGKTGSLA